MKQFTVHSGSEERRQLLMILICVFDYPVWVAVRTVYHSYCFGTQVALRLSCGRQRKRFFIWLRTQLCVMWNAFDFIILSYSMFVCVHITAEIKTLTCFIWFKLNMLTELLSTRGEDAPESISKKKTLNVKCSWDGVFPGNRCSHSNEKKNVPLITLIECLFKKSVIVH